MTRLSQWIALTSENLNKKTFSEHVAVPATAGIDYALFFPIVVLELALDRPRHVWKAQQIS